MALKYMWAFPSIISQDLLTAFNFKVPHYIASLKV